MNKKYISIIAKTAVLISIVATVTIFTGCGKNADVNEPEPTQEEQIPEPTDEEEQEVIQEVEELVVLDEHTAYESFLGISDAMSIKAIVDEEVPLGYDDYECNHAGEELSFAELKSIVLESKYLVSKTEVEVLYDFMKIGDKELLVLNFGSMSYYSPDDDSYTVVVLNYENEELHATYGFSSWCRSDTDLYSDGYMFNEGSGGAGASSYEEGFIGEDGQYHLIYYCDHLSGLWWLGSEIDFDAYVEVYGEDDDYPAVFGDLYTIGDMNYNVLLPNNETGEYTDDDLAFIGKTTAKGIVWSSVEDVNKIIEDRKAEFGIENKDPEERDSIIWRQLKEYEDGNVGTYYIQTNAWNWLTDDYMEESVGWSYTLTDKMKTQIVKGEAAVDMDVDGLNSLINQIDFENGDNEDIYLLASAGTYGAEDYFQVYTTGNGNTLITTPDGECVCLYEFVCDFIYMNLPEIQVADYDGDGDMELSIWVYNLHGTGFSQKTLYMVDRGGEYDSWRAYRLSSKFYDYELRKHYDAVDDGDGITVYLDRQERDYLEKTEGDGPYLIGGDMQVDVIPGDASNGEINFTLNILPWYYSEPTSIGIFSKWVQMDLSYLGDGDWKVNSVIMLDEEPERYNGRAN